MTARPRRTALARSLLAVVAVLVGGCSGPVLANPPAQAPIVVTPTEPPGPANDPLPVELPRDDAPHDRLTEWWYYTGHLRDADGGRWGFEYVIFRAERGEFPVSWASHLALTDESGGRFTYAQRAEIGPQVDLAMRSGMGGTTAEPLPAADAGFALAISGFDPTRAAVPAGTPWTMTGADGDDRLEAFAAASETAGDPRDIGLDLVLRTEKPPALHDRDGWIDFGPAGGSYYYSRTAMTAIGTLDVEGRTLDVEGSAWFDHQWGDFIAVGGGGWDWFAINLEDGTDLTISLVRNADGTYPLVYGTLVERDGTVRHLDREAFTLDVVERWTSRDTGADYPAGWRIEIPSEELVIDLAPTVADQELDTRATTGVVYWEGSQTVAATRSDRPLGGEGYVELTGYAGVAEPPSGAP